MANLSQKSIRMLWSLFGPDSKVTFEMPVIDQVIEIRNWLRHQVVEPKTGKVKEDK